jgi:hypothetical protein
LGVDVVITSTTEGETVEHQSLLPAGFEVLEQFVSDWVLPDAVARMTKRQSSDIRDIRRFYDAMLPLGERALVYLRDYQLGDLPTEGERLLKLMLSLAEVAPAVEWYDSPHVYDGFPISRIRYLRQIADNAAQR